MRTGRVERGDNVEGKAKKKDRDIQRGIINGDGPSAARESELDGDGDRSMEDMPTWR